jgi:hypothetical protein
MRKFALALSAAMTLASLPIPAMAQTFEIGPGGIRVQDYEGRRRGGGGGADCRELRLACENKDRLGERGAGNCRQYRQQCERRPSRQEVCRELRQACLYKDELGDRGGGNCREYRETCR